MLNTALRGAAGKFARFAIGMTVASRIMAFDAVTDASINSARTLGPAVGTGSLNETNPYMAARFIGAAVAALLYRFDFACELRAIKADQPKNRIIPFGISKILIDRATRHERCD